MHCCLLNILPPELFHVIFSYFWAHEVLTTFLNVNSYIDANVLSYQNYRVNFRSILKRHYDLICRILRPDQIISLILSDSIDTPRQSELFLSHFQLDSFTRLRSLTLDKVETNSLIIILDQLNKLDRNVGLALHSCNIKPLVTYNQLLSQLRSLKIGKNDSISPKIPFSLISIENSTLTGDEFQYICESASNLRLLNIHCDDTMATMRALLKLSKLTRLVLQTTGK